MLAHKTTIQTKKGPLIHLETLWPIILEIGELWTVQDETCCAGGTYQLGDVWLCSDTNQMIPFHKLSQWMLYSLIEPMEKLLGAVIEGTEQLTPLSDYFNGKLLTLYLKFPFLNFFLALRWFADRYRVLDPQESRL